MIYLYAITGPGQRPPDCSGLDDAEPFTIPIDGLRALCSRHETLTADVQPERLWRHELVVERAMECGPVLPVRFGSTFDSEQGLRDVLLPRAPALARQLDRVRDCVELAVRVAAPPGSQPAGGTGSGYLENKLARRRELTAAAERTLPPLERLAEAACHTDAAPDRPWVSASYLVRRAEVGRFVEEVRKLSHRQDGLTLSCTGPWAPYSFVGGAA